MSRMTALILSAFVVLTLIINVVTPDQSFSASENRSLAQFPKYNIYSLMNGDYTQKINNWFSDQFVGRSFLVKVKYLLQKMAMVKQIEDVYLGKDMLIEDTAAINQKNFDKNLAAINAFADAYPVAVTFIRGEGNAVATTATFIIDKSFPESLEQMLSEMDVGLKLEKLK